MVKPPKITTNRLTLRPVALEDAQFMVKLLNDESFIRFSGDRNIRTAEHAITYLQNLIEKNRISGDRLLVVNLLDEDRPIGICSLLKRAGLDAPDIGFALLPEFRGSGYAFETASATITYANTELGIERIVAITSPENVASISLLKKLGLCLDSKIQLNGDSRESLLFVTPSR